MSNNLNPSDPAGRSDVEIDPSADRNPLEALRPPPYFMISSNNPLEMFFCTLSQSKNRPFITTYTP